MGLTEYRKKRHFQRTSQPKGRPRAKAGALYVIQKHAASRLHYDFRLELGGTLKSWAVPKGPSLDPAVKALAVHVEDHPVDYGSFEGTIPQGEYGGGTVMLWDFGTWTAEGDADDGYRSGKLVFELDGERLKGRWALIRMNGKAGQDGKNWLLKKIEDAESRSNRDVDILREMSTSVATGRTMEQIAAGTAAARATRRPAGPASAKKSAKKERADRKSKSREPGRRIDPHTLDGSKRSAMPTQIAVELPLLVSEIPSGEGWLHELKLDGYRLVCFVRKGRVSLVTRGGHDWTKRFPTIAAAVERFEFFDAILDGEVVALTPDGRSDFQALQNKIRTENDGAIVYFVFDLLYYRGFDLRGATLLERKQTLSRLIGDSSLGATIRFSGHIPGQGELVFASACQHRLEGIVAKRSESRYQGGRGHDWVKVKCLSRQEFVIGRWTEPTGSRASLGALLVGCYRTPSELVYCGRVGTGFTGGTLRALRQALGPLARKTSPFHGRAGGLAARGLHWVAPKLLAEVDFASWTDYGLLRHASFKGIREDKEPGEVTRERPMSDGSSGQRPAQPKSAREIAGVRLTHPDRILFPDDKVTKSDLAEYYEAVAPFILPHIQGRPLSLLRCPEGVHEPCFFQKHLGESMPEAVRGIVVKEKSGSFTEIAVDDVKGLISLVQMGVLEIHPWGSREDQIERPDRLIFDLDPADESLWSRVVETAEQMRQRLEELGLTSFVRTTGGKGLHVVVPFVRRTTWEDLKTLAKAFADAFVRQDPARYVATASKAKRTGRIFIDYLRNERGATAVASYSTRARTGATVATPISWDELSADLRPAEFNVHTIPGRLNKMKRDPWKGFFELRQSLSRSMAERVRQW